MKIVTASLALVFFFIGQLPAQNKKGVSNQNKMKTTEQYTFPLSDQVTRQKVSFKNRYGIRISAEVYTLKGIDTSKKYPALIMSGPFGAVKEQSSGLYAETLAERGFITLAFDPSFTGESGGEVRNVGSPEMFTEDFSAAVDYLGLQSYVDRNQIGVMAICGLSGMALTAATSDTRIKAIATASMYDMSRSISKGYRDSYTPEQRHKIVDYLSEQRWKDAESGKYEIGLHEIPFDENGNIIKMHQGLPDILPANANPVLVDFFDYYKTKRGYHPRSINSTSAWTATTPVSFFSFPMMSNIGMISPRPVLLIAGEKAHSRYYSEDVFKMASEPKELVIVANATHCDLYDKKDLIPFDKIEKFFRDHLK